MQTFIDKDLCIGCGVCADSCPEVFRMTDDDHAEVYGTTTEENSDLVREAVENCPTDAITTE